MKLDNMTTIDQRRAFLECSQAEAFAVATNMDVRYKFLERLHPIRFVVNNYAHAIEHNQGMTATLSSFYLALRLSLWDYIICINRCLLNNLRRS
jgi:hypothetical protein